MDSSGSSIGGGGGGGRRRRRRLQGEAAAEARKLQSSQYKGVVPQPNGRWGAQIYEKHQRVWLGTFDDEAEAAKAYDIASHRIRGRDAVVNFSPLTDDSDGEEILFLSSHSKSEIVGMLRKHTYTDELNQSRHDWQFKSSGRLAAAAVPVVEKEVLFDKAVTPSDVGKLNRLVIPKQLAEKHFPLEIGVGGAGKGVLLNFEDGGGKVWRFRYSYWNSSQSYVLTKGWSRFVKEKRIKAGDVVTFQSSSSAGNEVRRLYIDSKPRAAVGGYEMMGGGYSFYPFLQPAAKVVRLFGVNFKIPVTEDGTVGSGGGWYGKRRRSEVEEIQYLREKRNSAMEN